MTSTPLGSEQLDFELSGVDDDQMHHDALLDGSC